MKLNQHLKDWKQIVSQKFPSLSLPQVSGLATWSFGMVMTQSSSLTICFHVNCQNQSGKRQYGTPKIERMVQRRKSQSQKRE